MYWLNGCSLPPKEVLPPSPSYTKLPEREKSISALMSAIHAATLPVAAAVENNNFPQWIIAADEFVDAVTNLTRTEVLWAYSDCTPGYGSCAEVLSVLECHHYQWMAIPTQEMFDLARKHSVETLATTENGNPVESKPQLPLMLPLPQLTPSVKLLDHWQMAHTYHCTLSTKPDIWAEPQELSHRLDPNLKRKRKRHRTWKIS